MGNTITTVTLESNHNRQQDANSGTIDSKSLAFTKVKKLNVNKESHIG